MNLRVLLPTLLLASLPACDFNDREDKDPGDDGEALDGVGCVDEITVLGGVDEASALGFSAAEVLAVVEGAHATPMAWGEGLDDGSVVVKFGPESGAAELSVGVSYKGGEVRYVKSSPEESEGDGAYADCQDRIEVDVAVTVESSGGAFAESFTAPLRATARGIGRIAHEIAVDEFAGSFAVTQLEPDNAEVKKVTFDLGISESGLFGGATTMIEIAEGEAVAAGFINVASWPSAASPCDFFEAPLGLDAAVADFSANDALALVAEAGALTLTWAGQAPTAMALTVTPGEVSCATDSGSSAGSLRIPATATVVTEDGRWDGSFPIEVYAVPAEDKSLASVRVSVAAAYASTVDSDQFLATFGLEGVDLAGFDGGGLDFSGEFTPGEGGAAAFGQVTVLAVNHADCSNEPGAPCEGDDISELDMATWSNK